MKKGKLKPMNKQDKQDLELILYRLLEQDKSVGKLEKHFNSKFNEIHEDISFIKENPFDLTEIKGIPFVMADNIARNLGFDQNSPKRAACALVYMLEQEAQNGHTCFPQKTLLDKTIEEMHKSTNGPIKIQILENQ